MKLLWWYQMSHSSKQDKMNARGMGRVEATRYPLPFTRLSPDQLRILREFEDRVHTRFREKEQEEQDALFL